VRTVVIEGEPWFVAADMVNAVGVTWSGNRIAHIQTQWKGMTSVVTPGGNQSMAVLSEKREATLWEQLGLL
jgi:prophage antirepressor-like protein